MVNQKTAQSKFIKPQPFKRFFLITDEKNYSFYKGRKSDFLSATFSNITFYQCGVWNMPYINEKAPYFYEANYFVLFASTNKTKPNKLMKLKDK